MDSIENEILQSFDLKYIFWDELTNSFHVKNAYKLGKVWNNMSNLEAFPPSL